MRLKMMERKAGSESFVFFFLLVLLFFPRRVRLNYLCQIYLVLLLVNTLTVKNGY
jgi:hypothetical protein